MEDIKPKLTTEEQILKLKKKGIQFCLYAESDAYSYLKANNNYFKLTSYRKNFTKIQNGPRKGIYENLDFGYLVDLAVIDTRLRIIALEMALNIEHFAKVNLLNYISEDNQEDGYSIVSEYIGHLTEKNRNRLNKDIEKNESGEYCGDIIKKYNKNYPIWAFVEILSFGSFLSFYKFCAYKYNDKGLQDNYYLMLSVKCIRNAAAHNNCVINNLLGRASKYKTNRSLIRDLAKNKQISRQARITQLDKLRVQQLVSLLYAHKTIVTSTGMHAHISERLNDFSARIFKYCDYAECEPLRRSLEFIIKIIDFWFKIV